MSTHEVKVVKIQNIDKHTNADSLVLTNIWGYTCIVGKDQFNLGDLAAYIEPDYLVPLDRPEFEFLKKPESNKTHERITIRRFRGIYSEGLLIPAPKGSKEGDNVMELLGVQRYEPQMFPASSKGGGSLGSAHAETGPEFKVPEYDLENLKKNKDVLVDGEEVIYTCKLHGCLHGDTLLETELGFLSIGDIVNNRINTKVKSYNHDLNIVEYKEIITWSSDENNQIDWFMIELEDGTTIKLTGNHKVFLPDLNCYRAVEDLAGNERFLLDM